jgi:SAM-dependent methyltransferase
MSGVSAPAADQWRRALGAWALPEEIVASASESPWAFPPELFDVPDVIVSTPSRERAREVLPEGGSVLDVGCGGGAAAYALTPPASVVIGVDPSREMLALFRVNAQRRAVSCQVIEGAWPDVAAVAPDADVVTAHHVAYNVGDIVPFLDALGSHARQRVVLELTVHHPLTSLSPAWRHFWGLERPETPTSSDLLDVLSEMDIPAHSESWLGAARPVGDAEQVARRLRVRLCLPASREQEVRAFLSTQPAVATRELTTIWWDRS